MRYKLISCEVFYREMLATAAAARPMVDVEFLPKGLHDIGAEPMRARIQAVLNAVDESRYDAVLFGYGLCNNGLAGLESRSIPLVLPRAHDCITLFLGGKERYLRYFNNNPGVYFKTTGWMERGENPDELSQLSIQRRTGMDMQWDELVVKYGEDNARYIWDTLCDDTHNYGQFTFIEMGVEPNDSYVNKTRSDAEERGWKFAVERGDIGLIERMLNGEWDAREFLVVPPGHRVVADYTENIISAEPV